MGVGHLHWQVQGSSSSPTSIAMKEIGRNLELVDCDPFVQMQPFLPTMPCVH